jgi:hypothetical protein
MASLRSLLQRLADPNLAFLLLSIGTLALIYELASPGMGLGGVLGTIMLVLGVVALSVLPVGLAGQLLGLAAALFVGEVLTPGVWGVRRRGPPRPTGFLPALWRAYRFPTGFQPVHSALHNPNTPPSAIPLVSGPVIQLPGHHAKVRRDGYRAARQ